MRTLKPSKSRILKLRAKGLNWQKIAKYYNSRKSTILKAAKSFGIDTAKIVRKPVVKKLKLSLEHRKKISEGLKKYWQMVRFQVQVTADFYNAAENELKKDVQGYSKSCISKSYIIKEETDEETGLTAIEEALKHGQANAGGYNWAVVAETVRVKIIRYTPKTRYKQLERGRAILKAKEEKTVQIFNEYITNTMDTLGLTKAQAVSVVRKSPAYRKRLKQEVEKK